jgi:hypothetical protein
MSVEHKVLGFRPPPGSLAAEAQAAAAKHPDVSGVQPPATEKLNEAAKVDAERILYVLLLFMWTVKLKDVVIGRNGSKKRTAVIVMAPPSRRSWLIA